MTRQPHIVSYRQHIQHSSFTHIGRQCTPICRWVLMKMQQSICVVNSNLGALIRATFRGTTSFPVGTRRNRGQSERLCFIGRVHGSTGPWNHLTTSHRRIQPVVATPTTSGKAGQHAAARSNRGFSQVCIARNGHMTSILVRILLGRNHCTTSGRSGSRLGFLMVHGE